MKRFEIHIGIDAAGSYIDREYVGDGGYCDADEAQAIIDALQAERAAIADCLNVACRDLNCEEAKDCTLDEIRNGIDRIVFAHNQKTERGDNIIDEAVGLIFSVFATFPIDDDDWRKLEAQAKDFIAKHGKKREEG